MTSLCPCVPGVEPHPDDVTILFLDYDVIIFDDVNPLGYCDVTVSLCPWRRTPLSLLLIKPLLRRNPDEFIIHVGTNSLRSSNTPRECAVELIDLAEAVSSQSSAMISISGLINRSDDEALARKVPDVNKVLKECCQQKNWGFVDHSNISRTSHLNRSGLHLNKKGTTRLAQNLIHHLRVDQDIAVWESDSTDVHKDTDCGKSICPTIFGRGLAIASLNIISLVSHVDELRVFMSSSKVDILYINESKLDSTVRDNEVYIPGFEIVTKDRKLTEGMVVEYVHMFALI